MHLSQETIAITHWTASHSCHAQMWAKSGYRVIWTLLRSWNLNLQACFHDIYFIGNCVIQHHYQGLNNGVNLRRGSLFVQPMTNEGGDLKPVLKTFFSLVLLIVKNSSLKRQTVFCNKFISCVVLEPASKTDSNTIMNLWNLNHFDQPIALTI